MTGVIVERLYEPNTRLQVEALSRLLGEAGGRPSGATKLERDGLSMAVGGAIVSGNEAKAQLPQQHRDPHDQVELTIRADPKRRGLLKAQRNRGDEGAAR